LLEALILAQVTFTTLADLEAWLTTNPVPPWVDPLPWRAGGQHTHRHLNREIQDGAIEKLRMALRAWFCVDAATCCSVARWISKASISGRPMSRGWRFWWNRIKRRIQSMELCSVW
jgi:hypothetical protein